MHFIRPTPVTFPIHLSLLDLIIKIMSGDESKSWNSLCKFFQVPVTTSDVAQNMLPSTLFLNTLSL
jgi:hypothetical protein